MTPRSPAADPFVRVEPGEFLMGSPAGDAMRSADELHCQATTVARPFYIGATVVTFDQWQAYADDIRTAYRPSDMGWGAGDRPVMNVSWNDARGYLDWLTVRTGLHHRLPTEVEWEYAARAGTATRFWWGDSPDRDFANFSTKRAEPGARPNARRTEPVRSYPQNPWGLFDMNGNVWEWCDDPWQTPALPDTPRSSGRRILRGGAWDSDPHMIRNAYRTHLADWVRMNNVGFRVVREIEG